MAAASTWYHILAALRTLLISKRQLIMHPSLPPLGHGSFPSSYFGTVTIQPYALPPAQRRRRTREIRSSGAGTAFLFQWRGEGILQLHANHQKNYCGTGNPSARPPLPVHTVSKLISRDSLSPGTDEDDILRSGGALECDVNRKHRPWARVIENGCSCTRRQEDNSRVPSFALITPEGDAWQLERRG